MSDSHLHLSIVIPAYNEEESIPHLLEWIEQVLRQQKLRYEAILIDDGSTDNTWGVIHESGKTYSWVKGIRLRRNYGKSAALNTGFEHARGDVVVTMDADMQDSPEEIPELYKMIREEHYDLVSGWKKKRYDPISKTIPTKLFNAATRKISGLPLHDFNCGLKAYRKTVVKNIEIQGEMHRYIPVIAKWAGFRNIGEKVVEHQSRKYGTTKFGMERFINGFLDLLTITFVGKFGKRPMHFMGALGTLFFVAGFIILLYLTISKWFMAVGNIDERPLFYFGILVLIVGTQLFVTGFLAELVVRNSDMRNDYQIAEKSGFTPSE